LAISLYPFHLLTKEKEKEKNISQFRKSILIIFSPSKYFEFLKISELKKDNHQRI
jgi:hypothetical protein